MNAFCRNLVVAAIVLLPAAPGQSAANAEEPGPTLNVITYNVQFLPRVARRLNKRPDAEYRAEAIGEQLRRYDLVGLNEMFDQKPGDLLLETLRAGYGESYHQELPPAKATSTLGIGSGLACVSRLPIVDSHYLRYSMSNRPIKNLLFADGVAAKGAIHVRLRQATHAEPPLEVDVYVTHLESRDAAVRRRQCKSLARFIGQHKAAGRPALILGDLNIDGGPEAQADKDSSYHGMLRDLCAALPDHDLDDAWALLGEGAGATLVAGEDIPGERIDYVLVANPKAGAPRLLPRSIRVNDFADERVGTLSDHAAVEAEFEWRRP